MKLRIVTVGLRIPGWAQTAYDDYAKRFGADLRVELVPVKAQTRGSQTTAQIMAAEAERIQSVLNRGDRIVILDERGTSVTTQQLASKLKTWQEGGTDVALLIGGADGMDPQLKKMAHETLRLSDLTLPHAMVRVLLIEQLYRAWSINIGHPYHRD